MPVTIQDMMADIPGGYTRPHAKYPPIITSMETLGTIEDCSGRSYSRDGGRSSMLGGHAYYLFGRTSWQLPNGNPVNRNNTAAIVMNPARPLISAYLSLRRDGTVKTFLAPTSDENSVMMEGGPRVRLQPTGGIVETSPGVGWMYYQKEDEYEGASRPRGTGVTMVNVLAVTGEVETIRGGGDLLFGPEEPRVGSLSSIIEGDYLYSWGHYGNGVLLARVPKRKPWDRGAHTFWNGDAYVEDWRAAKAVMVDVQEGAVMKSGLFGAGKEWVFVGGTRRADGRVVVGAAASIEGPWEMTEVCTVGGVDCIYPHEWVYEEVNGELMVTWREGRPGRVMAGKLKLEMGKVEPEAHYFTISPDKGYTGDPTYWKAVTINNCSSKPQSQLSIGHIVKVITDAIRQYLSPNAEEVAHICAQCAVNVTTEGRLVMQGFSPPEGVISLHLRVEVKSSVIERTAIVNS